MRILITGGAGFVGSSLAKLFKSQGASKVVVLDNLKRRGSEINLKSFSELGIEFHHGDIRNPSDLESLEGKFDLFIEASAEPSVLAGLNGNPDYLIDTNLTGTVNCLNFARKKADRFLFLSTSRVYSLHPLRNLPLAAKGTRLAPALHEPIPGFSEKGIAENFSTSSARSLYGATKLCSEMLIQEYANTYKTKALINRCGVIAGPGQFGKTDQGVFTLWIARHFFDGSLQYTGFGGEGMQVRDLLHPRDLFALIQKQLGNDSHWDGEIYNVGGGNNCSTSLLEWTKIAEFVTHKSIEIKKNPETNPMDVPWYVSDNTKVNKKFQWQPMVSREEIAAEIAHWLKDHQAQLKPLFQ